MRSIFPLYTEIRIFNVPDACKIVFRFPRVMQEGAVLNIDSDLDTSRCLVDHRVFDSALNCKLHFIKLTH